MQARAVGDMGQPGGDGDGECSTGRPDPREPLAPRSLSEPHLDRLRPDDPAYPLVIAAHEAALRAGADSYQDPKSGLVVLTAGFLARRGYCCESGCRHCPYVQ